MPRKPLIRSDTHPYHVINRTNNKEIFPLAMKSLWPLFVETMAATKRKYPFDLHCFVLMNNHYHLLIQTPQLNLDRIMHDFNMKLSHKIARASGRINRIFGARYKWSLIMDQKYYLNVYRYVYQNPIRDHLTERVEHYQYSSLNPELKKFALFDKRSKSYLLSDLNLTIEEKERLSIQKGLAKTIYKPVHLRPY